VKCNFAHRSVPPYPPRAALAWVRPRPTRKYLRMNLPSRPLSGAPHRRHSIWWSGGGPASARTSLYSAAQFGQSKRVVSGMVSQFEFGGRGDRAATSQRSRNRIAMAGRARMLVHPGCGQPSKVSKTVIPKVTTPWIVTTLLSVLSEQPVGDLAEHVIVEDRSRREELLSESSSPRLVVALGLTLLSLRSWRRCVPGDCC
jgi:hypothetical protein